MRGVGKRKAKNQPCKSPSPDIANRNIIKNTSIEVDNIKAKMKQAEQKVFRFQLQSSSSHIPDLSATLELKYRQLHQEFNKVKIENSQLKDHNYLLADQNKKLRQSQSQIPQPMVQSVLIKPGSQPFQQQNLNTVSQSKVLLQQLNQQRSRNQQNNRYLDLLRSNEARYKQQIDRLVSQNRYYEQQLVNCSQKVSYLHEETYHKVNDLHLRLNKLQTLKRVIDQKHSRLFAQNMPRTPPTTKKQYKPRSFTDSLNKSKQVQSFIYTSPEAPKNLQYLQQENRQLKEQLRSRRKDLERSTLQKDNLLMIIRDHQNQANSRSSSPSFVNTHPSSPEHLSRLNIINEEAQQELQDLKRQNKQLNNKIFEKQLQYGTERNKLIDSIEHYRKLLEGYKSQLKGKYCENCKYKDDEIVSLKRTLQALGQQQRQNLHNQSVQLQHKLQDYQLNIKQIQENSMQEIRYLKDQNSQLQSRNKKLSEKLSQLTTQLNFIKKYLQIDQISDLLNKNYGLFCDLQGICNKKQEEFNKSITVYKERCLQKEQQLVSMECELSLKKKQIQLLQMQLSRIKKMRNQYRSQSQTGSEWKLQRDQKQLLKNKNTQFRNNQLKIIDNIRESNQKLFNLSNSQYVSGQQSISHSQYQSPGRQLQY